MEKCVSNTLSWFTVCNLETQLMTHYLSEPSPLPDNFKYDDEGRTYTSLGDTCPQVRVH